MIITKENTGALTATLKIEIFQADYSEKVEAQLVDYRKKANLPGFRVGKVPMGIVKKLYEKAVIGDEVNKLLSENIAKHLEKENIEIIGNPLPNYELTGTVDLETMTDFTYYFDLGIQPEINIALSEDIEVEYAKIRVEDEQIDNYIADLKKKNGTTITADSVEEGDLLKCDFAQLDAEGEILKDGIQNSASLSLEEIQLKTIKKKFIGKQVGAIVKFDPMHAIKNAVDVAAMLNITKEEAEILTGDFAVTINEITRRQDAELNEELFKKTYPQEEITNEEELRARVAKDVAVSFSAETDRHFVNMCIEKIIEVANVDLPKDFIKRWVMETNQEEEMTEDQLDLQMDSFLKSMRWNMVETKLVKAYPELSISQDDLRNHIKGLFLNGQEENEEMNERADMIVNSLMNNKEQVKGIYDHVFEERLKTTFKNHLKVVEKEHSYEEFVEMINKSYEK